MEQQLITMIEAAIRGLKFGTKRPDDEYMSKLFKRLQVVNEGQHDDLLKKYVTQIKEYDKRFGEVKK